MKQSPINPYPISKLFSFTFIIWTLCSVGILKAQNENCDAATLEEFYACYGGEDAFSAHSVNAVTSFIQAEDAIKSGDYEQAKVLVDNLFNVYPKGSTIWWNVFNAPNGANIGTPHAYYGLRMIEDIVDHHLNGQNPIDVKTAVMKIVLVGCSEGIQPATNDELENGSGPFVTNAIDESLAEDNYRIIYQSFEFFSRYVTAITKGQLNIEIEIVELPNLCMPVSVSSTTPYFATGSIQPVWEALSDEVKEGTDWWWIMYPSHVPEYPDFDDKAFITGGMGLDQKGGPAFIIDDKWIVRKPAHLGDGNYSDIERRIYLPQWLQHEFFHHLYRAYPELNLEVNGHDWFDLSFWPSDFEGRFEPDYYAESLHKRLQVDCSPLASKLITKKTNEQQALFNQLSVEELLGSYSLDNVQNEWHIGSIIQEGNRYFWRNNANVQWEVFPNISEGTLKTGADSPYPGQDFNIQLYQTVEGDYIPGVIGLNYQGELYRKRFNLLQETVPFEIAIGPYERVPNTTSIHLGQVIKQQGNLYWEDEAGNQWILTPDADNISFQLNEDSPTPDLSFQLILFEDECDTYVLGFKYLDHYYWKPKRDPSNQSPIIINTISDIELDENFGSYTIDLSSVFQDPENNDLFLYATSSFSELLSIEINDLELELSGNETGSYTIYVMALDANGGLVVDDFEVLVGNVSATENNQHTDNAITVFPNPVKDFLSISGHSTEINISIFTADHSLIKKAVLPKKGAQVDIRNLNPGMYFIQIKDHQGSIVGFNKFIKE